jgi:hypothetical protein
MPRKSNDQQSTSLPLWGADEVLHHDAEANPGDGPGPQKHPQMRRPHDDQQRGPDKPERDGGRQDLVVGIGRAGRRRRVGRRVDKPVMPASENLHKTCTKHKAQNRTSASLRQTWFTCRHGITPQSMLALLASSV